MKVYEYLIHQDLFENKKELLIELRLNPDQLLKNMVSIFEIEGITVDAITKNYLNYKDYTGKDINTMEKLLNLDVYKFMPVVIKGKNTNTCQMTLNEYMKPNLKVIKNSNTNCV